MLSVHAAVRKSFTVIASSRTTMRSSNDPLCGFPALQIRAGYTKQGDVPPWISPQTMELGKCTFSHTVLSFLPYDMYKHWDLVLSLQNSSKSSTWIVLILKEQPYRLPLVPVLGPENTSWPLSRSTVFDTTQCWILTNLHLLYTAPGSPGKREVGLVELSTRKRNYFPHNIFLPISAVA